MFWLHFVESQAFTFALMKYSRLSKEQLIEMENEFIDFLVVNGITADDWEKLKDASPSKADDIIDQFSDVVWEGTLRKATYLERSTEDKLFCFKFEKDKVLLLLIKSKSGREIHAASFHEQNLSDLTVQKAEKGYTQKREAEMFQLITSGAEISNGELFKRLSLAI